MKNIIRSNNQIIRQKKKYLFLLIILGIGIISGIIFIFLLSSKDRSLIKDNYELIFSSFKNNNVNYFKTFINSISTNLFSLIVMYILAISIIGIPITIFYLFIKGFIFGLSLSSIINIYGFKGILLSISYLIPHHLIILVLFVLLSFYAISFSLKLFRYLFLKENIPLNKYFFNLNKVYILGISIMLVCSLIETFLTPFLIDLCL